MVLKVESLLGQWRKPGSDSQRILVVDGQTPILTRIVRYLTDAGFTVERTADSAAFWEALALPPDLILIDISALHNEVLEIYRRIKANPATQHIPIFLLTRNTAAQMAVIAQMSVKEVITGPFALERFGAVVDRHLHRQS